MAVLKKEIQEFIVECFARYLPPREIITQVKENFGIDLTHQEVYYYNPNGKSDLGQDLREHFQQYREEYNKNIQDIGGASKSFRVQQLTEIFFELKKNKQYKLASEIIKQLEEMDKAQQGTGEQHINDAIKQIISTYANSQEDPSHSKFTLIDEQGESVEADTLGNKDAEVIQ